MSVKFLIGIMVLPHLIFSQQKWKSKFGFSGVDIGYDVVQALNGQYVVTGYTGSFSFGNSDVMFAIVDSTGWLRAFKNIGGANNDIGKAIVSTQDSGFVIAGYTNSYGAGGYDGYLIKTNKTGQLIWQKTFGGTNWDVFNSLIQTPDKGFVAVGYTYSNAYGGKDAWIVKTDSLGNMQWQKHLGGINDDDFASVEQIADGRIICLGTTYSYTDIKGNYWIYKTTLTNDSLFVKDFGYPNLQDVGYDFFQRPIDGAFVVVGTSQSPFGTDTTYFHTLIVDSLTNFICDLKNTHGAMQHQINYSDAYFWGYKSFIISSDYGLGEGKLEAGFYIFQNNNFLSGATYGSPGDDVIYSCKRTKDKGLITVGYTTGFNAIQEDVFIVKLDSTLQGCNNVVGIFDYQKQEDFIIYPTVFSDRVYFKKPDDVQSYEIIIVSLQGEEMLHKEWKESKMSIEFPDLADGLYIVYVKTSENIFVKKIIKQN